MQKVRVYSWSRPHAHAIIPSGLGTRLSQADMGKLTLAVVSDLAKGQDVREIAKLDASKQGITEVDDLG